jgi:hypothetical protein
MGYGPVAERAAAAFSGGSRGNHIKLKKTKKKNRKKVQNKSRKRKLKIFR